MKKIHYYSELFTSLLGREPDPHRRPGRRRALPDLHGAGAAGRGRAGGAVFRADPADLLDP